VNSSAEGVQQSTTLSSACFLSGRRVEGTWLTVEPRVQAPGSAPRALHGAQTHGRGTSKYGCGIILYTTVLLCIPQYYSGGLVVCSGGCCIPGLPL